jgi:phage protein U
MANNMMSLGLFAFGMETLAYQEFRRVNAWKHADVARIGTRDGNQFLGIGAETVNLPGLITPQIQGRRASLDALRKMGDTGLAYVLVDGTGSVYGAYVIDNLTETATLFFGDGTPRRIEFDLSLKRVDESRVDDDVAMADSSQLMAGDLVNAGMSA